MCTNDPIKCQTSVLVGPVQYSTGCLEIYMKFMLWMFGDCEENRHKKCKIKDTFDI